MTTILSSVRSNTKVLTDEPEGYVGYSSYRAVIEHTSYCEVLIKSTFLLGVFSASQLLPNCRDKEKMI